MVSVFFWCEYALVSVCVVSATKKCTKTTEMSVRLFPSSTVLAD